MRPASEVFPVEEAAVGWALIPPGQELSGIAPKKASQINRQIWHDNWIKMMKRKLANFLIQ